MKICEIFTSIQGESSFAGFPCTFIRLSGCNLKCVYCDTGYCDEAKQEMSEDDIIAQVSIIGVRLVEVTGGEPLLQDAAFHLIERLINEGHKVLIETNGSQSIKDIDPRATIIMDIKTPASGMADAMDFTNLEYIKKTDEIKFVVLDRKDFLWAKTFIEDNDLTGKCNVLISPAFGFLDPESLSNWIIEERMDVRLNLQMHKFIFKESARGV